MEAAVATMFLERLCFTITAQCQFISGVSSDVEWLRQELRTLRSLLHNADRFSEDEQLNGLMHCFDAVRDMVFDSEDIIEVFELEPLPGSGFSRFFRELISRYRIGLQIRRIRSDVAEISRRRSDFRLVHGSLVNDCDGSSGRKSLRHRLQSSPLVSDGDLVGVNKDLDVILRWVLGGDGEDQLSVMLVVGMGGIGKTTLVKRLFNHTDVKKHFERTVWIYGSPSIRLHDLFVRMVKGLLAIPSAAAAKLDDAELQEMLLVGLRGQRYLVVLDDVWDAGLWTDLRHVLPKNGNGSKVIVTTRNRDVASSMTDVAARVHDLQPLSREDSWALFCSRALGATDAPEELREMVELMTKRCDGLPLAIVTMGGMMSRKERTELEWKRVLDGGGARRGSEVHDALFLSYQDLPFVLKQCFLYCSVFPPDFEIPRKRLIRLWIGDRLIPLEEEGTTEPRERIGERYFMELVARSMLQVSKVSSSGMVKTCRVHNVLHELAVSISEREGFLAICKDQGSSLQNNARRISVQNAAIMSRGKKLQSLRSLFMFDKGAGLSPHVSKKFRMLRVLDLEEAGICEFPREVGNLIHLRYVSVKGTRIKKLPKSIENLIKLQTLDIRKTQLSVLPFGLEKLKQLRHLEMGQVEQSIVVPSGLGCLESLQVVTGLQAIDSTIRDLSMLTHLRKLGVECEKVDSISSLYSSLNKMKNLSSLSMICREDVEPLKLADLTPPPLLQKLHLLGCLGSRLPEWFSGCRNLTKLRLVLSRLNDDPMSTLGMLPNLIFLQLYEAYKGNVMRCSRHGFSKLKILVLTGLEELEEWAIEEGALPSIQELWIMSCSALSAIPSGFEFLTTMKMLRLVGMPESFLERLDPSVGEDYSKVQYIPTIQAID